MNSKKTSPVQSPLKKNPLETLSDLGGAVASNTVDSFKKMGSGMMDQIFGTYDDDDNDDTNEAWQNMLSDKNKEDAKEAKQKINSESNLFNYTQHHESVIIKEQIKKLVEQIRREIDAIKKADKSLLNEVQDIQAIAINGLPEKPGIYHVRFLEIVLRILSTLRARVGESRTWMQALISKKKKRGSLFAARSKKQGTSYSMSQELSNARSVQ